jgi:hypothetical protein
MFRVDELLGERMDVIACVVVTLLLRCCCVDVGLDVGPQTDYVLNTMINNNRTRMSPTMVMVLPVDDQYGLLLGFGIGTIGEFL